MNEVEETKAFGSCPTPNEVVCFSSISHTRRKFDDASNFWFLARSTVFTVCIQGIPTNSSQYSKAQLGVTLFQYKWRSATIDFGKQFHLGKIPN